MLLHLLLSNVIEKYNNQNKYVAIRSNNVVARLIVGKQVSGWGDIFPENIRTKSL